MINLRQTFHGLTVDNPEEEALLVHVPAVNTVLKCVLRHHPIDLGRLLLAQSEDPSNCLSKHIQNHLAKANLPPSLSSSVKGRKRRSGLCASIRGTLWQTTPSISFIMFIDPNKRVPFPTQLRAVSSSILQHFLYVRLSLV